MKLERGGWIFTRQAGIGEIEHIRTSLLGICLFHDDHIDQQILGALKAAERLQMMLRVHVNAELMSEAALLLALRIMAQHNRHQIELWPALTKTEFMKKVGERAEIFVQPVLPDLETTAEAVEAGILEIWERSGGRFLKGNFAFLSRHDVMRLHPDVFPNLNEHWLDFSRESKS